MPWVFCDSRGAGLRGPNNEVLRTEVQIGSIVPHFAFSEPGSSGSSVSSASCLGPSHTGQTFFEDTGIKG